MVVLVGGRTDLKQMCELWTQNELVSLGNGDRRTSCLNRLRNRRFADESIVNTG